MPKYTEAEKDSVCEAIIQSVTAGQSVKGFLKANKKYGYSVWSVFKWLKSEKFKDRYEEAKRDGREYLLTECVDIADEIVHLRKDPDYTDIEMKDIINIAKVRIDTRLRLAGHFNRGNNGNDDDKKDGVVVYNSPSHDDSVDDSRDSGL